MTLLSRFRALGPRRLAASATAFGLIALATALTVTPASAGALVIVALHNDSTTLCLDSNAAGYVYGVECGRAPGNPNDDPDPYQSWILWDNGSLGLGLQDAATGRCLDSNYAHAVYTSGCNANDTYQEWTASENGVGIVYQDVETGFCLDGNTAGNIYTSPCNWNNWYQNWQW